jgi:hypothetical protein
MSRLRARLERPAEDLGWLLIPAAALVLAAAFAWLTPTLSKLYPSPAGDLFPIWQMAMSIQPEPLEEVRSVLTLATPFVLAVLLLFLGTAGPSRRALDPAVIAIQVAGVALLVIAVLNQPRGGPLLANSYFDPYLVSVPNLIAGVVIGLLLTAATLRPPGWRWLVAVRDALASRTGWRWIAVAIAIAITVIWILPAVNTDDTAPRAGLLASGHIPIQGDDYFAAVNGRTPLVNYISQYANLLPLALEPVLKAAGPSITSLSISVSVLSAIAMIAIYGAFAVVTRGAWTALGLYVPWVALSLFPWHDIGPYREFNGIYYGVFPGRYFGPFLLALLCATSLRRRRPSAYLLFLFAGLVLLNNYEFGIGALLALIAGIAAGWDPDLPVRRDLVNLVLRAAAGLLTAGALVCGITLIRTGELPDPALLTYYNRLFLRDSFGLEPMSSLGVHWALYATYAAALLVAAVRVVRRDPDRVLTGMLAFSGVFGLATGMYFVGRSTQFQLMLLFPPWGLSLALLTWTAIHSLRAAAADRARLRRLLLPALTALIGFGVMVSAIDRLPQPQQQVDRLRAGGTPDSVTPRAVRFVESQTYPGEDILLIGTAPDHLVADRAGVVNVSPLNGITSLFSPAEANRALDQLQDAGGSVVIERTTALPPVGFALGIPQLATILRQHGYELVSEDRGLHLRVWRKAEGPRSPGA